MAHEFQAGHLVPVSWQATGGQVFSLNIKEHSLDISVLLHDVTGVKAAGLRARIAGPTDIQGRVVLDWDLEESPFSEPGLILAGTMGVAVFGVDTAGRHGIQCPLICEKYHQGGATDRELMWDCDWKCSSLAGSLVYPAL